MHETPTILTDVHSRCLSVSLSVTNAPNDPGPASLSAAAAHAVYCERDRSAQLSPNAFGLSFSFRVLMTLDFICVHCMFLVECFCELLLRVMCRCRLA